MTLAGVGVGADDATAARRDGVEILSKPSKDVLAMRRRTATLVVTEVRTRRRWSRRIDGRSLRISIQDRSFGRTKEAGEVDDVVATSNWSTAVDEALRRRGSIARPARLAGCSR